MVVRFCEWVLIGVGAVLLAAAVLPFVVVFGIPEPYATELMAAKLVMLPAGAICMLGAMALRARLRH